MDFSCLISCYHKDSPTQLAEALESIVRQTKPPTELIFVEDGKLSRLLYQVLEEFDDKLPLKRIRLEENNGLGNALNQGLLHCSNNIVMRMDTDDICHPQRFDEQLNFLIKHPDIDIVGSWAIDINNKGETIGERTFPTRNEDLIKIIWSCPLAHPTVAFRRDAILGIGSYRKDVKRRQDYDLWLRAAVNGLKFANIPKFLLYYRFTDDYYKKNSLGVAWSQAVMGLKGLRSLNEKRMYPYFAIFSPVLRSILPRFIEKPVHRLLKRVDPRNQKVILHKIND